MNQLQSKASGKATRCLKVYTKATMRSGRLLQSTQYISLPEIRLHGRWLEALDFNSGDMVQVDCSKGRIVITLAGR